MWIFGWDQIYAYTFSEYIKVRKLAAFEQTQPKEFCLIRLKKIKNAIANFCSQYSLFMSQIKYFDVFEW